MAAMVGTAATVAGLSLRSISSGASTSGRQLIVQGLPRLRVNRHLDSSVKLAVRATQKQDTPLPDTKVDISESDVRANEGKEPLRLFDQSPVGKFARPESERRPELGNTEFASVMKFDGPAPETINGRLAMLGITWAFIAEIMTRQTVVDQVFQGTGLIWFLLVAPLFIGASFIPIFGWNESPDSRAFGPFNAKAERWNGRVAMIAFLWLLLSEQFIFHGPAFGVFMK